MYKQVSNYYKSGIKSSLESFSIAFYQYLNPVGYFYMQLSNFAFCL